MSYNFLSETETPSDPDWLQSAGFENIDGRYEISSISGLTIRLDPETMSAAIGRYNRGDLETFVSIDYPYTRGKTRLLVKALGVDLEEPWE